MAQAATHVNDATKHRCHTPALPCTTRPATAEQRAKNGAPTRAPRAVVRQKLDAAPAGRRGGGGGSRVADLPIHCLLGRQAAEGEHKAKTK